MTKIKEDPRVFHRVITEKTAEEKPKAPRSKPSDAKKTSKSKRRA